MAAPNPRHIRGDEVRDYIKGGLVRLGESVSITESSGSTIEPTDQSYPLWHIITTAILNAMQYKKKIFRLDHNCLQGPHDVYVTLTEKIGKKRQEYFPQVLMTLVNIAGIIDRKSKDNVALRSYFEGIGKIGDEPNVIVVNRDVWSRSTTSTSPSLMPELDKALTDFGLAALPNESTAATTTAAAAAPGEAAATNTASDDEQEGSKDGEANE